MMNKKFNFPHHLMTHRGMVTALLLAMGAGLSFSVGVQTASASSAWISTQTHAAAEPDAMILGAAEQQQPLSVVVTLKLQHQEQLQALIEDLQRPGSSRQPLSSQAAQAMFAPAAADAQRVANYLQRLGFKQVQIGPGRLYVSAEGTVASARAAFNTDIVRAQRDGRSGLLNTADAQVPVELGGAVDHVFGLNTLKIAHVMSIRGKPATADAVMPELASASKAADPAKPRSFYPQEVAKVYNGDKLPAASKTSVAIIGWGEMDGTVAALRYYEKDSGIPETSTRIVAVDDPAGDRSAELEWELDTQTMIGASGGVKSLLFYTGANSFASDVKKMSRAVSDNIAKVINMSWGFGICEADADGPLDEFDSFFKMGAVQGQTFVASSGDNGAFPCDNSGNLTYGRRVASLEYPALSPYVTAVGGTVLYASDRNAVPSNRYVAETTWSYSGGGISKYAAKPAWQHALPGNKRQLPDVAFLSDPYKSPVVIYLVENPQTGDKAGYYNFGGTSLAAPVFAGFWARLQSAHANQLGFAPPLLYSYAGASLLHDVTAGNNGYYKAARGYDLTTGLGSFDVKALSDAISVASKH